jgi:hypothetical protein
MSAEVPNLLELLEISREHISKQHSGTFLYILHRCT